MQHLVNPRIRVMGDSRLPFFPQNEPWEKHFHFKSAAGSTSPFKHSWHMPNDQTLHTLSVHVVTREDTEINTSKKPSCSNNHSTQCGLLKHNESNDSKQIKHGQINHLPEEGINLALYSLYRIPDPTMEYATKFTAVTQKRHKCLIFMEKFCLLAVTSPFDDETLKSLFWIGRITITL